MEKILKTALWRLLGLLFQRTNKPAPLPIDFQQIRSVLVIRPDRLGDVILSTPVYESIKQSFPGIKLSVLVHQDQEEILRDNPFIDRIICFRHGHLLHIWRELKEEKFDVAIVLNSIFSATAATLALLSRAAIRVGYENRQGAWVYNVNVLKGIQTKHEIQHNLDLLRFLGLPIIRDAPRIDFDESVAQKIGHLLIEKKRYPDRPLVLIKPGARVRQWGWSLDKFRKVAARLLETKQAEVFIICGPGEEKLVASFRRDMLHLAVTLPVLPTRELAFLIKQADLLLCNHTGIMHLASAVKTPVVAIFKHGDAKRWGPYQTRHLILDERNGDDLSPEKVLEAMGQMLSPPSTDKDNIL